MMENGNRILRECPENAKTRLKKAKAVLRKVRMLKMAKLTFFSKRSPRRKYSPSP